MEAQKKIDKSTSAVVIYPPSSFSKKALIDSLEKYSFLYKESIENPELFWGKAAQEIEWFRSWEKVSNGRFIDSQWFCGGSLNVAFNCLDRHLKGDRRNKRAIIWEGENGECLSYTYEELAKEVAIVANVLKRHGVRKSDTVVIYMPLIPQAIITMLACARIGAIHNVVFAGFSAKALLERIQDSEASIVVTADGGFRRGKIIPLKARVDEAASMSSQIKKVLVYKRVGCSIQMIPGRDYWMEEELQKVEEHCEPIALDSEHPLFILYTSGTTGKPKGIVHSSAGYLVQVALSTKMIFDLKEKDLYWCTADIGWITGHSYVVYGPLANGASIFIYEGAPDYPSVDRFWRLIDAHKITIFYTSPTAIRAFIKWGTSWIENYDLSSLRLLGSVGEPINPEVWLWFYRHVGKERCPIVDTWWQTETGSILISALPGATPMKPGSATLPFFGILPDVVDEKGQSLPPGRNGFLVIKRPWPSLLRGIHKDETSFKKIYFSRIPGVYFTGDGAYKDEEGYFWITGRIDDVINVSGHRIGSAEVESALVSHPAVAEAAVVGIPDSTKGEAILGFVTLKEGYLPSTELSEALKDHVVKEIGSLARPKEIRFLDTLPKTRSGKIVRRLLKEISLEGRITGDTTTLEDSQFIDKIAKAKNDFP
ncbi:acetate--CoA ligase [Candidatus Methylacidiphilum infernorum]|uniref:Acetyl-coenzyme A synthetase n=1 Tax=Candidatus Methylacidiphilum infernorum TaxID=511746 RepID=A0ABX7PTA6_9BACT|nr:acetate--CoA ligase [Candidatus Methylacidiphilum infernorum]QSR86127.1 acetate--CoA ligase [Candidatus Methylacidiphilum infernorum]